MTPPTAPKKKADLPCWAFISPAQVVFCETHRDSILNCLKRKEARVVELEKILDLLLTLIERQRDVPWSEVIAEARRTLERGKG